MVYTFSALFSSCQSYEITSVNDQPSTVCEGNVLNYSLITPVVIKSESAF